MKHTHNCGRNAPKSSCGVKTLGCKLTCKCRCHHLLYGPARNVIACWEQGNLAEAVQRLARAVAEFEER